MNENNQDYNIPDMREILKTPHKTTSTKEALSDVTHIDWSKDILKGKKKVVIDIAEKV